MMKKSVIHLVLIIVLSSLSIFSFILCINSKNIHQFFLFFLLALFLVFATAMLLVNKHDFADDWSILKITNGETGKISYKIQYLYLGRWRIASDYMYGFFGSNEYSEFEFNKVERRVKYLKGINKKDKQEMISVDI